MPDLFPSKPEIVDTTQSAGATPMLSVFQGAKPIKVPNRFVQGFLKMEEENAKFRKERAKRDAAATAPIEEKRQEIQTAEPKPSLNPATRLTGWASDLSFSGIVDKLKLSVEVVDALTKWSPLRRNEWRDKLSTAGPEGIATATQEGQEYLTTTVLQKLEGKNLAGVQEVRDLLRGQGVTQRERQAVEESLAEFGDVKKVRVEDLKNAVQSRLLPLTPTHILEEAQHASTNLKKGQKPEGTDYGEIVYESPIQNTAGEGHFNGEDFHAGITDRFEREYANDPVMGPILKKLRGSGITDAEERIYEQAIDEYASKFSGGAVPGYFAHVRYEDLHTYMADEGAIPERRVLEIQSDLFQGDIKDALPRPGGDTLAEQTALTDELWATNPRAKELKDEIADFNTPNREAKIDEYNELYSDFVNVKKGNTDLATLSPYSQNWHERVIREELRRAAQDGIKTVKFPTGETAAMIEGHTGNSAFLGQISRAEMNSFVPYHGMEMMKVGQVDGETAYLLNVNNHNLLNDLNGVHPGSPKITTDDMFRFIQDTNYATDVKKGILTPEYQAEHGGVRGERSDDIQAALDELIENGDLSDSYTEVVPLKSSTDLSASQISTRMREIDSEIKKVQTVLDEPQVTPRPESFLNPLRQDIRKLESERSILQIRYDYEVRYPRYIKKLHPEMERVTDEFGVQWYEVIIDPVKDGGDVLSKNDEDPNKPLV